MAEYFSHISLLNDRNHINNKVMLSSELSDKSIWGIEGFLTTDLAISNASTKWGSLWGDSELLNTLSNLYNRGAQALDITTGIDLPNVKLQSVLATVLTYSGTEPFQLVLPLTFIALTRKDVETNMVLNAIKSIKKAEYPNMPNVTDTSLVMEAPLGYMNSSVDKANIKGGTTGAIAIQIGQYFSTRRLFVVTSSNFTVSRESTYNNSPLFAIGSITFQACRTLSADEIAGFFTIQND